MELLYWLQLHRTPLGEHAMNAITHLGSDTAVILALCALLWLCGRRIALRVAITFGCCALTNQLIKVLFAVPRPWLRDSRLVPVESAVADATGYSFPSGHTQTATSLYASIALTFRRHWLSACCAACILGVMCSRLYLGVHTPLDVVVGCALSLGITWALDRLLSRAEAHPQYYRNVFACGALAAMGMAAFTLARVALGAPLAMTGDILPAAGGMLGFVYGIYLDSRRPEALPTPGWGLALSCAGLAIVCGLRLALGCALTPLLGRYWGGFVRYALIALYVARVHPAAVRAVLRRFPATARGRHLDAN